MGFIVSWVILLIMVKFNNIFLCHMDLRVKQTSEWSTFVIAALQRSNHCDHISVFSIREYWSRLYIQHMCVKSFKGETFCSYTASLKKECAKTCTLMPWCKRVIFYSVIQLFHVKTFVVFIKLWNWSLKFSTSTVHRLNQIS